MAAGMSDHVWTLREIAGLLIEGSLRLQPVRWWPRGKLDKLLEIPTRERIVRIWLNDGGMGLENPDGEGHWDGWATVDDIASGLVEFAQVPPEEAHSVAVEAVRQWEEWLGDRRHRYPEKSN
jgi:hypothetical protein